MVQINLHTATADAVYEMMNQGLVDIALFMEPFNTEGLDYVRIHKSEHWIVRMRADDPLAQKDFITKQDLMERGLSGGANAGIKRYQLLNKLGLPAHMSANAMLQAIRGHFTPIPPRTFDERDTLHHHLQLYRHILSL